MVPLFARVMLQPCWPAQCKEVQKLLNMLSKASRQLAGSGLTSAGWGLVDRAHRGLGKHYTAHRLVK